MSADADFSGRMSDGISCLVSQTRMMPFNGLVELCLLDVVLKLCSLSSPIAFWAGLCTLVLGMSMM